MNLFLLIVLIYLKVKITTDWFGLHFQSISHKLLHIGRTKLQ